MGFGLVIVLAIIGEWLRRQRGAPWISRKMPATLIVLESWCFFAWFYGDRMRSSNVDGYFAHSSDATSDYERGVAILTFSSAAGALVAALATVALVYGVIAVSAAKKRAAPSAREP